MRVLGSISLGIIWTFGFLGCAPDPDTNMDFSEETSDDVWMASEDIGEPEKALGQIEFLGTWEVTEATHEGETIELRRAKSLSLPMET